MLWTLALEAVRQKENQVARLLPFAFCTGDELINDHLGTIDEISKLSLPADQHIWCEKGVAVIKSKDGSFGQERIVNTKQPLVWGEILQRNAALTSLGVIEHGVPLTEGPASAILSGESDAMAFGQKRGESECLAISPVDTFPALDGFPARCQETFCDRRVKSETFRRLQKAEA